MLILARALATDHEVTVIAQQWDSEALTGVRILPVPEERALTRWQANSQWLQGVLTRLKELADRHVAFDVVHSTGVVAPSRVMPGPRLVVATWHCCASEADRVFRSGGMRYAGTRLSLKAMVNGFGRLKGRLAAADEHRRARVGADQQWVAVSAGTARDLESWHRPHRPVRVIHNGSGYRAEMCDEQQRYRIRNRIGVTDEDLVCLIVAQGNWGHKGLFDVLAAYQTLPDSIKLLVVGGGAMLKGIERDIRARGLSNRVILCGWQNDPSTFYCAADVFVQASYAESFSLVAMEAANAGLAITTTRVNGVDEYLRDGASALYMSHDPGSIRRNILALRENPTLRRDLGRNAHSATAHFTTERMVRSYEELYLTEFRDKHVLSEVGVAPCVS